MLTPRLNLKTDLNILNSNEIEIQIMALCCTCSTVDTPGNCGREEVGW